MVCLERLMEENKSSNIPKHQQQALQSDLFNFLRFFGWANLLNEVLPDVNPVPQLLRFMIVTSIGSLLKPLMSLKCLFSSQSVALLPRLGLTVCRRSSSLAADVPTATPNNVPRP